MTECVKLSCCNVSIPPDGGGGTTRPLQGDTLGCHAVSIFPDGGGSKRPYKVFSISILNLLCIKICCKKLFADCAIYA